MAIAIVRRAITLEREPIGRLYPIVGKIIMREGYHFRI